ncbi:MAG: Uma2 family endonuclease [Acidobacteriota bacterium]|nr:Uma2 family endonuclease [Acidobacteriota bacterium]
MADIASRAQSERWTTMMLVARTAQVAALLSIQDLETMPDDCLHRELIEGELIELPPPEFNHSLIAHRIYKALDAYVVPRNLGMVLIEMGYLVRSDRRTWIQPDVSFFLAGRYDLKKLGKYATGAPDLAIEVISPSETARSVNRKTAILLESGCQEVWNVYSDTRTVEIHSASKAIRRVGHADDITSPLFPGWSAQVRSFFGD